MGRPHWAELPVRRRAGNRELLIVSRRRALEGLCCCVRGRKLSIVAPPALEAMRTSMRSSPGQGIGTPARLVIARGENGAGRLTPQPALGMDPRAGCAALITLRWRIGGS